MNADRPQRRTHWDHVYQTKADDEVSWFELHPETSLEVIRSVLPDDGRVIDIGGGSSRLIDHLLNVTTGELAVLDISEVALGRSRKRLGDQANRVRWIVGDVTDIAEVGTFDVWHDRAVFHFLTSREERRRYVELALRSIAPRGHLVMAVFALDGPPKCSGLDVCRYDGAGLASELGSRFRLLRELPYRHITPSGKLQSFCLAVFRMDP